MISCDEIKKGGKGACGVLQTSLFISFPVVPPPGPLFQPSNLIDGDDVEISNKNLYEKYKQHLLSCLILVYSSAFLSCDHAVG